MRHGGLVAGDEQIRARIVQPRQALELTEAESWQLLQSVSLGRIVFTRHAMPAIRPVNHLVDDKMIVIRSHLGSAIVTRASADDGTVVAYEADEIDPVRHTGWSVIATGIAQLIRESAAITRYQQLLEPWAAGQMDYVISIKPQIITGVRLVGWCR
jgi:nitroimidazol reductase NimA-like FMN-containing flavoprotein (pyridoxamine 5'-phosphate oxidase superfamily)